MDKKYKNDVANGNANNTIFVEPARGYSAPSYTVPSLTYWNPILRSRANKLIAKRRKMVETYTTPLLQSSSLSTSAPASASVTTGGNGNCGGEGEGMETSTNDYADRVAETDNDIDRTTPSPVFNSDSNTSREMMMFLNEFYKTIYTEERQEHYRRVRERLPEVNQYYISLVKNDATMMPIITMEQFWERYEWRVGDGSVERVMKELETNDKRERAKRTKAREEEKYAQEQKHQTAVRLAEQKREEERLKRLERAVEEQRARMDIKINNTTDADHKKKGEKDPVSIVHDGDNPSQKVLSPPGPAPPSSSNHVSTNDEQSKKKNLIHDMFHQDEQRKRREAKEVQVGLAKFARNFHAFTGALTSDDNLQNGTNILEKKLEHIADETIRKNDDNLNRRQQRQSSNNNDDGPDAEAVTTGGDSINPKTSSSSVVKEYQESAAYSSGNMFTSTTVLLVLWAATSVLWFGLVIRFAQNPDLAVVTMVATSYNMLCGPVRPGWYLNINQIESNWWTYNGYPNVWSYDARRRVKATTVLYNSPWWSGEGLVKELTTILSHIPRLWFFASSSVDSDEGIVQSTRDFRDFSDTVCSRMLKSLDGRIDVHGLLPPDQQSHLQLTISPNWYMFIAESEIQIFADKKEKSSTWLASKKAKKKAKRKIHYKRSSVLHTKSGSAVLHKNSGGGLRYISVSWDGMYIIERRLTFDKNQCKELDMCAEQFPWPGFVESRTKFVAPWAVDTTKLSVSRKQSM